MPVYQLGNGNDYFDSATRADWTNDSAVFGGNGNDTILASAVFPYSDAPIFLDGGNGDDFIDLQYASHGVVFGGNGNDTLTTGGSSNTLSGGNGDDTLIGISGGSGMQPGVTLTGGLGRDTFQLANDGNLVVTNDPAGDGIVSDGDVFKGPMDVITDYQQGEHIGLRNYGATTDTLLARVGGATLAPDPYTQDYLRPVVGSSQYAVFHGIFAGGNTFTVSADGPDLFALYDTRTGPNEVVGKGGLVLQGVTDERLLDQALSPLTAQGPGGWDYSLFDANRAGQDAAMPAVFDKPADSVGAMGVIPT